MSDPDAGTGDIDRIFDVFIIGGGVNGCGIARDAAGRGLSVGLADMNDLGGATSSASTKLFHGGLRYLEYFEFRLVREALIERERLLRAMPHIARPMRFVMPFHAAMRFEADTPTSRLLTRIMPWSKGRRPAWLLRVGLFLYDTLGGRKLLPATATLDLTETAEGRPLKPVYRRAFEYSDVWVDDSRLVILNARDAAARGATILPRTRVTSAHAANGVWTVTLKVDGTETTVRARALVNAGGPWAGDIARAVTGTGGQGSVRLVRGSHIVTRKLYEHAKCYFFQGPDGRIIFAIPYENDFTLIGTTDQDHADADTPPECTDAEKTYLLAFANRFFETPVTEDDVVWTYSGVRPLFDDGAKSATAATRDYVVKLDQTAGATVVNVFGGKITTYRRLAEAVLAKLGEALEITQDDWTAGVPLPGGDFPVDGVAALAQELRAGFPFIDERWAARLVRMYGTDAKRMLDGAESREDLGEDFGATITARELDWAVSREWARTAEDFLWRRSKLGLHLDPVGAARVDAYLRASRPR